MTQLDSITWFAQIFWFLVIFFSLYILIYKNFGPLCFYNQNLHAAKINKHYASMISYDSLNVETKFRRFSIIFDKFLLRGYIA